MTRAHVPIAVIMGVLKDFERRLEGAVEGFFARAFRSGLQPIELAKALQRYAEDNRHVTTDGVVVPNAYRATISATDHERWETYGDALEVELTEVVTATAAEREWKLRGPARVEVLAGDVRVGRYELTGRVEPTATPPARPDAVPAPAASTPAPAPADTGEETAALPSETGGDTVVSTGPRGAWLVDGDGDEHPLSPPRATLGRLATCDVTIDDTTVSREHAAFVRRGDTWWLLDLGSTNGSRVNDVQAAEQPLRDGDTITVGDASLTFRGVS